MNGRQYDEAEKLRGEVLIQVGDSLRDHYGDILKEDLPSRLADLLRRLVAPCEARSKRGQGGCAEQS
jgi:hypothetical protein